MALINFKKGLLASLPSTYAEGTFYITTDERAIYLDVADDKRIRLGDFQEFADLAALEANANPSTSALYYITDGNILAKWDGAKYVQINVQKTLAELGGVSEATFNALASKVNALEVTGGQANVIETVKVNGVALPVTDKAVDVTVPTGALALKDKVEKADLATELSTELDNKVDATTYNTDKATFALKTEVESAIGSVHTHANKDELDKINDGDVAKWNAEVGAKALAEAAAVKTEVENALAGKVDKVEGKSLISDSEITRLASVTNYDDTQVKADIAKKVDAETMTTELGKKVDKVEGYSLVADTEIARLADVDNYDDTALVGRVAAIEGDYLKAEDKYDDSALAARVKTLEDNPYVLPDDVVRDSDLTVYRTSADQDVIDNGIKGRIEVLEAIDHDKLAEDASAAAVAAVLDGAPEKFDTLKEIAAWIADANTAEDAASLVTRVSTIEGDYLKSTDKTELEGKINAKTTTAEVKDQIEAYGYATEADLTLAEGRIKAIEDDYLKGADKTALQAEIDADVKVVNDALEAYKTANNAAVALKANSADVYAKTETFTQEEVNAAIATAVETALTWGAF